MGSCASSSKAGGRVSPTAGGGSDGKPAGKREAGGSSKTEDIERDSASEFDSEADTLGLDVINGDYKVLRALGKGAFATVVLCEPLLKSDARPDKVAIKVFNKSVLKRQRDYKRVAGKMVMETALQKVQKEIALMKKIRHDNIVNLFEVIDDPGSNQLFMVLELVASGQVMDWQEAEHRYSSALTGGALPADVARAYMRDIVVGMRYVHRHHIVHRDLKPENLLLSADGRVKIADFGVAHLFDSTDIKGDDEAAARARRASEAGELSNTEGTFAFMAPECMTGDAYSGYIADVWAMGVVLYAFISGRLPFYKPSMAALMDAITEGVVTMPEEAADDEQLLQLLAGMLAKNPEERLTLDAIARHPWMNRGYDTPLSEAEEQDVVEVTAEEVEGAITLAIDFAKAAKLKVAMQRRLSAARLRLSAGADELEAAVGKARLAAAAGDVVAEEDEDGSDGAAEHAAAAAAPAAADATDAPAAAAAAAGDGAAAAGVGEEEGKEAAGLAVASADKSAAGGRDASADVATAAEGSSAKVAPTGAAVEGATDVAGDAAAGADAASPSAAS